jgi:hypothetical protein
MPLNKITGSTFRKMVMKASGTKGYLSSSVQKHLQTSGGKRFLKDHSVVTKQQATKIMKGLKEGGLVHKVTSDATTFVRKGFAHEERRQEMIKKQNVGERAKEISAEKQAEAAKATAKAGATMRKPVRSVQLASGEVGDKKPVAVVANDFVGSSYGSTNVKKLDPLSPNFKPPSAAASNPAKPEEDLIDMAID